MENNANVSRLFTKFNIYIKFAKVDQHYRVDLHCKFKEFQKMDLFP